MQNTSKTPITIISTIVASILFLTSACLAETPTPEPTAHLTNIPLITDTSTFSASPTVANSPTLTSTVLTFTPTQSVTKTKTSTPSRTSTHTKTKIPTRSPTLPPAYTATLSAFKLLSLTSPIPVDGTARAQIKTVPGATCYLSYTTPAGSDSKARGLGSTIASTSGICSWSWNIGPKTRLGTGTIAFTANGLTQYFDIVIQ